MPTYILCRVQDCQHTASVLAQSQSYARCAARQLLMAAHTLTVCLALFRCWWCVGGIWTNMTHGLAHLACAWNCPACCVVFWGSAEWWCCSSRTTTSCRTYSTSHHIILRHITAHHITSHHITSHHITSDVAHHITSDVAHHITSDVAHHITSNHITSHHSTLHHITSHHITSHHITSQHNTSVQIRSDHSTAQHSTARTRCCHLTNMTASLQSHCLLISCTVAAFVQHLLKINNIQCAHRRQN
jgi:hypothetical protein